MSNLSSFAAQLETVVAVVVSHTVFNDGTSVGACRQGVVQIPSVIRVVMRYAVFKHIVVAGLGFGSKSVCVNAGFIPVFIRLTVNHCIVRRPQASAASLLGDGQSRVAGSVVNQTGIHRVVASMDHNSSGTNLILAVHIQTFYIPVVGIQHKELRFSASDHNLSNSDEGLYGLLIS